jgi:hypothetical protein
MYLFPFWDRILIFKIRFQARSQNLRKATVSFVMSVCPSAWNKSALTRQICLRIARAERLVAADGSAASSFVMPRTCIFLSIFRFLCQVCDSECFCQYCQSVLDDPTVCRSDHCTVINTALLVSCFCAKRRDTETIPVDRCTVFLWNYRNWFM